MFFNLTLKYLVQSKVVKKSQVKIRVRNLAKQIILFRSSLMVFVLLELGKFLFSFFFFFKNELVPKLNDFLKNLEEDEQKIVDEFLKIYANSADAKNFKNAKDYSSMIVDIFPKEKMKQDVHNMFVLFSVLVSLFLIRGIII